MSPPASIATRKERSCRHDSTLVPFARRRPDRPRLSLATRPEGWPPSIRKLVLRWKPQQFPCSSRRKPRGGVERRGQVDGDKSGRLEIIDRIGATGAAAVAFQMGAFMLLLCFAGARSCRSLFAGERRGLFGHSAMPLVNRIHCRRTLLIGGFIDYPS